MVSFMLTEINRLRAVGFKVEQADGIESNWEAFASDVRVSTKSAEVAGGQARFEEQASRSRYRYVAELYLAALLYYTNKFGDEDVLLAKERLFTWAYSLRVDLLRVQFRSIDNYGRGEGDAESAFTLLRDASAKRELSRLTARGLDRHPEHERALRDLLRTLGAP